jgi:DNA polymerase V
VIDLTDKAHAQMGLFSQSKDNTRLMHVMDRINVIWGRGTLRSAAEGIQKDWKMKWERMSPGYTTNWEQVPVAHDF